MQLHGLQNPLLSQLEKEPGNPRNRVSGQVDSTVPFEREGQGEPEPDHLQTHPCSKLALPFRHQTRYL